MEKYDVIVIGAGHNGLIAAAYLAKAGKKVLVLERRSMIGGAAVTEEIYPGFKYSCATLCGLPEPRIIRELRLDRYGLEILPFDPIVFSPTPNGESLLIWRDKNKILEELARFSKSDATSYPLFASLVDRLSKFLLPIWARRAPEPMKTKPLEIFGIAWRFRRLGQKGMRELLRLLTMSIADFLNEWFENELLKATLAAGGIAGTFLSPRSQGTSSIFLYHQRGEFRGGFRAWGFVRSGTGNLPEAIASAARRYGAEIRTDAEVARVLLRDGAARGVVLGTGDEITSRVVVSNADPRNTFFKLVGPLHLEPDFAAKVRHIKFRGACAQMSVALGELPTFRGTRPGAGPHHRGLIHIGPSLDYLEHAFDEAKYGSFSRKPFLEITIPSVTDPSLAPPGKHVMSILAQYTPYHLREGSWREKREELADLVIDTVNEYAPNFKTSILDRRILTPLDLEQIYGLTEGNVYHGELSLDQLFFMRPVPGWARYRTPVENLYLCGSGTHPGGGITGLPGRNAAREILRDWGKVK